MRTRSHYFILAAMILSGIFILSGCGKNKISLTNYYAYDQNLPLKDSLYQIKDTTDYNLYYITYRSIHDRRVTGLLSVPDKGDLPYPVIILLHGLGDNKQVDYIEYGNRVLLDSGYAVLRIDISNHGDRHIDDYDFDLVDGYRYWTRDMVTQTVFDLRRAVDFIETRKDLDPERIGFLGISLGGIIGTIFCSIDERVEVPVIVLAGGQLNLMFGQKALSQETRDYLSVIDPINYVRQISPRPLLMINAEHDDVVPPVTSKLLYAKAKKPKRIIWYPARHHTLPVDQTYAEGIKHFRTFLR